jgi:vesicle coat complex subunit
MGCLRVDKVLDYLCEPLRRALQDENAYVRKTAAVCAAKVVELSPELAEENGFVEMLRDMLGDNNASVDFHC